jgi:cyanophycinase
MFVRLASCLAPLLIVSVVAAQNTFGIPEPDRVDRPGTILLHGGGRISDEVFDRFVELAGGRSARIVLVPSAGFDSRNYDTYAEFLQAVRYRYNSWFSLKRNGQITEFTILHSEDPGDADQPRFIAPLKRATGVWFTGGDQGRLNYRYVGGENETRFQIELKNVLCRGGVVGGTSAGTAVLPEIMTMGASQEEAWEPLSARVAHGLGVMNRVVVEQHFDTRQGRLERFLGLLKDHERLAEWSHHPDAGSLMMGLAVDEPAAAELCGSRLRCWGPGHVHLFLQRDNGRVIEWHDIESDKTIQVIPRIATNSYEIRN